MTSGRLLRWIRIVAIGAFLVHAGGYLYFFVDDEAIPYVYAQNLLDGHGLVYSQEDGHVEGFSDFLHLMLAAGILTVTRALHLPPLAVFPIGKAISLMAGCALIWLAGMTLQRLRIEDPAIHAGAAALLALCGPLAVWSCSSLEAVPFALGLAVLVYALAGDPVMPRTAALATVFLVLERSDGFVWVAGLAAAFWLFPSGRPRQSILWSVALPGIVAAVGLEVFRILYYGDILPMPVYAKVLFKLHDNGMLVEKRPSDSYAVQLVQTFGRGPLLVAGLLAIIGALRWRPLRPLLLGAALLAGYASLVGDWMFGFRFYLPLLVPAVVLIVSALAGARPAVAWGAVVILTVQAGISARSFQQAYLHPRNDTPRENFWSVRSLAPWHFFRPEYDLIEMLRPMVTPHEQVSYNQAGLIPYALNLENIDTLGICSRYYAALPARDVIYTEVGRYEPFTEAPIVTARGAYLLNRRPALIIDSTIPLQRVNEGSVPRTILAGHYALAGIDRSGLKAVYRPTGASTDEYRREPDAFLTNLGHAAYVARATSGDQVVTGASLLRAMPFLVGGEMVMGVRDKYSWQVALGRDEGIVTYAYIGAVRVDRRGVLHVRLRARDGRTVLAEDVPVDRQYRMWSKPLSPPAAVTTMELDLDLDDGQPQVMYLADVRLMGQTPTLRGFVTSQVRFDSQH